MKFFDSKNAELKNMNRILTEAARNRTERNDELQREVDQLRQAVTYLQTTQAAAQTQAAIAIEQAKLMEEVAFQRAQLLNERIEELAKVREATTKYSSWAQELDRLLGATGLKEAERLEARRTHMGDID